RTVSLQTYSVCSLRQSRRSVRTRFQARTRTFSPPAGVFPREGLHTRLAILAFDDAVSLCGQIPLRLFSILLGRSNLTLSPWNHCHSFPIPLSSRRDLHPSSPLFRGALIGNSSPMLSSCCRSLSRESDPQRPCHCLLFVIWASLLTVSCCRIMPSLILLSSY